MYNNSTKTTLNDSADGIPYNYAREVSLMNDRLGSTGVGIDSGNIRYYGATPNNYIDIGDANKVDTKNWIEPMLQVGVPEAYIPTTEDSCKEFMTCENLVAMGFPQLPDIGTCTAVLPSLFQELGYSGVDEFCGTSPAGSIRYLYRIIGLFKDVRLSDGTTKDLVKVMRDESIGNYSWDTSASTVNDGWGINEWSQADIQIILNEYYAGNSTSCKYCNDERQEKCENDCASIVKKLGADAKKMIENAVWYTGGIQFGDKDGEEITSAPDAYSRERGTRGGRNCKASGTKGYCTDKVERTTSWTGLVGLLYPSDYGYASGNNSCLADITYNNVCSSNNWLSTGYSYWTMTPRDSNYFANAGWHVGIGALGDNVMSTSKSIKPVVYLKDSIKVLNGDGTEDNPYKLGF